MTPTSFRRHTQRLRYLLMALVLLVLTILLLVVNSPSLGMDRWQQLNAGVFSLALSLFFLGCSQQSFGKKRP
ncbi:hypothetical protein SAMN05421823_101561 [Catalinimonas alkaloidigena]|uniref:Uncharacterized protein n=1 Tax=Catalinimonas alkaloidigena TaxID=1075417 RepID=A0A1G8Y3R5_9BACT|nr:hypothetical protein [Catalinimonas alkaloidigena]SDJ97462.1 hypothetical protein SAMN05421823_101561 [Catalinimonas alkaloidigena]